MSKKKKETVWIIEYNYPLKVEVLDRGCAYVKYKTMGFNIIGKLIDYFKIIPEHKTYKTKELCEKVILENTISNIEERLQKLEKRKWWHFYG